MSEILVSPGLLTLNCAQKPQSKVQDLRLLLFGADLRPCVAHLGGEVAKTTEERCR
jgi:hypothetical protein